MSTFIEVPAEIVMERPSIHNNCLWTWTICQPDAAWAQWCSGYHYDRNKAHEQAVMALKEVHKQQTI